MNPIANSTIAIMYAIHLVSSLRRNGTLNTQIFNSPGVAGAVFWKST